jgi:hypothetical protein
MSSAISKYCFSAVILLSLNVDGFSQSDIQTQVVQNSFQDFAAQHGNLYTGAGLPSVSHKEETKGSRYLFRGWVEGSIITANGGLIKNDSLKYNFDKITQNLFLTDDEKRVIEVDKREMKAIRFEDSGKVWVFKHIDIINNEDFFQELVEYKPDKFSLYKKITTRLKKSDYFTDGIYESGNDYDEFIDKFEYFIIFPDKQYRSLFLLKKKSIEQAFDVTAVKDKVNLYFQQHKSETVNDDYLKGLIIYLNQQ